VKKKKYNPQPTTATKKKSTANHNPQQQQQKFEYRSCKETKGKICARNKGWKKKHTRKSLLACLLAAYTQVATNFMICVQCQ
jgi:hypothetical protein